MRDPASKYIDNIPEDDIQGCTLASDTHGHIYKLVYWTLNFLITCRMLQSFLTLVARSSIDNRKETSAVGTDSKRCEMQKRLCPLVAQKLSSRLAVNENLPAAISESQGQHLRPLQVL